MKLWRSVLRDVLMFIFGAIGFFHELWTVGVERPFILTACLALMGLPFVLNGKGRNGGNGDKH